MTDYKRGDVVLVDLEPIRGSEQKGNSRPCLIVSRNLQNRLLPVVIICPFTTARKLKTELLALTHVPAGNGGLDADSFLIAYQIRVIDKTRIISQIGHLDDRFIHSIDESLRAVLDLD